MLDSRFFEYKSQWIGVVYDTVSLTVRCVVNPDSDEELDDPAFTMNNHPQLKMLRIPRGEYEANNMSNGEVASLIEKIETQLQDKPVDQIVSCRCAGIDDNGIVQHLIMAQPGIDILEGHVLMLTQTALMGDRYDGKIFWTQVGHFDNDTHICKEILEVDLSKHIPLENHYVLPLHSLNIKVGDKSP